MAFQTFERTNKLYWQTLRTEWENEKRKILDTLTGQAQNIPDISSFNVFEVFLFSLFYPQWSI